MIQMSGLRMKIAGRFEPCVHMGCFDLEVFVEMNQRSRKASKYDERLYVSAFFQIVSLNATDIHVSHKIILWSN